MSNTPVTPESSVIRCSASVVIVNVRNEVLLVHRNPKSRTFAGFHVFPGGNFDADQDDSLKMTAIRETFEETGILLASSRSSLVSIDERTLNEARQLIYSQSMAFRTFLDQHHLTPNFTALLPFTQWVTPVGAPRRFRTQFFIAFVGELSNDGKEEEEEHIPMPDASQEVISARFVHPRDAIAEFQDHRISVMPPQYYILSTLAEIFQTHKNSAGDRDKVRTLSDGAFGRMVINPQWLRTSDEGRRVLVYEGDETRRGSKGRLHRALIKVGKGGILTDITLLRNFDIFSEIEEQAFQISERPKL